MFSVASLVCAKMWRCLVNNRCALFSLWCVLSLFSQTFAIGDVIWAVNSGGEAHTDVHGIKYQSDRLKNGIPSDYGKTLMIQRVVPPDQILYQTERYHYSTFGYEIPIKEDGDYVLVLKFCEVWFTSPNQKVRYMSPSPTPHNSPHDHCSHFPLLAGSLFTCTQGQKVRWLAVVFCV